MYSINTTNSAASITTALVRERENFEFATTLLTPVRHRCILFALTDSCASSAEAAEEGSLTDGRRAEPAEG